MRHNHMSRVPKFVTLGNNLGCHLGRVSLEGRCRLRLASSIGFDDDLLWRSCMIKIIKLNFLKFKTAITRYCFVGVE
jgi:hypothetical protein